jgi:hypothetical protein
MVVKIHGSIGPRSLSCCGLPPCECATHSLYVAVLPALWMCHSLYVAVLPPCGCATVFMLRFSRPVNVPQSLCCGSPALRKCHSLYVAVLPPCGCATVFMLRFSHPVNVPQSLCCGSPALRKCHSLYVLSNTHDAIRYFRPAIA